MSIPFPFPLPFCYSAIPPCVNKLVFIPMSLPIPASSANTLNAIAGSQHQAISEQ